MTSQPHLPTDPADLNPKKVSDLVIDGFNAAINGDPDQSAALTRHVHGELRMIVAGAIPGGDTEVASRACRAYGNLCGLMTLAAGHSEEHGWDFTLDRIDDLNATIESLLTMLGRDLTREQLVASVHRDLSPIAYAADDDVSDADFGSDLLFAAANLVTLAVAVA